MWGVIIILMFVLGMTGVFVCAKALAASAASSPLKDKLFKGRERLAFLSCLLLMTILFVVLWRGISVINALIVFLHLEVFIGLFALLFRLIRAILKKESPRKEYAYVAAFVFGAVYLFYAYFNAHHVVLKEYEIKSAKVSRAYTVQLVADAHIGSNLDGDSFAREMEKLGERDADALVICGDLVDDETSRDDMVKSCAALGKLAESRKVVYVFGNHDRGYFGPEYRDFTAEDLVNELVFNRVTVLQDRAVDIGDELLILGREDRSVRGRDQYGSLTAELDNDRFIVVADHQPKEYDEAAEAGVDLVLSGHTHGGQLIPFNRMGELFGLDDMSYGMGVRDETTFIVTSGISNWELEFRTGCHAETVEIRILPENAE